MQKSRFYTLVEDYVNGLNAGQTNPAAAFPKIGNLSPSLSASTLSGDEAVPPAIDPTLLGAEALSASQQQQAEAGAETSSAVLQAKKLETERRLRQIQAGIKPVN